MASNNAALAKGQTSTATGSPAPVVVNAKTAISIKFRLFAAEQTAKLNTAHKGHGPSNGLNGLALILGTVEGGSFKPFEDRIRTAPVPVTMTGKLVGGAFYPMTASELAEMKKADAKRKDKALKADEREKASTEYTEKYGKVASVNVHTIPLPKRIEEGTTIAMCINVDAKKKFRKHALWQVKAGANDIVIDVFETYGQRDLNDAAKLAETREEGTKEAPKPVNYYVAELSGNVWMRSTHPYTNSDVTALEDSVANTAMKTALGKIYAADFVADNSNFAIDVPNGKAAAEARSVRLLWIASENSNCTSNVKGIEVKRDVPCRIHPAAYAAVASAALEAELTEVRFSSSWRPMLGSMGHRSGRGLDIVWLKDANSSTRMNRSGLTSKSTTDKDKDGTVDDAVKHGNLKVEEQEAFNAWKKAEADENAAVAAANRAKAKLASAQKALALATKTNNADTIEKATHTQEEAQKAVDAANDTVIAAEKATPVKKELWAKQVSKHQPGKVDKFRRALMKASVVTQIIDPWYVDLNTKDGKDGAVNEQKKDGVQNIHNNHLHITIHDSELQG